MLQTRQTYSPSNILTNKQICHYCTHRGLARLLVGATKLHSKLVFVVLATTTFDEFLLKACNVWVPGGSGGSGPEGPVPPSPLIFLGLIEQKEKNNIMLLLALPELRS